MDFVIFHSVNYGAARFLQFARIMEVALFVEPRHQFDDDGNLFAALAGFAERVDDARMVRQSVDRDLYRKNALIFGAFV